MIFFDDNKAILGAVAMHSEFTPSVLTGEQFAANLNLYAANKLLANLDVTISLKIVPMLTRRYTSDDLGIMTIHCNPIRESFFNDEELIKEMVLHFVQDDIFMIELQKFWEFAEEKLPAFAFIQNTGELQEHFHYKFVKLLLSNDTFNCSFTWNRQKPIRFKLSK